MSDQGRYIAAEINTRTGCHQILNVKTLPRAEAIELFHACLPKWDADLHEHLQRHLFKAHNTLGVPE